MIFQEPMVSLNPAYTIENQLIEALLTHRKISKSEARNRAIDMLKAVEIPSPEKRIKDYPYQLSGGMRQRVMIAEALLLSPDVLLADEPTTALDVTIQAQVLDIMRRLAQSHGTAIMLITHNMGILDEYAQKIVVMYAGQISEKGATSQVLDSPGHPYTQGLLRSMPSRSAGKKRLLEMPGIVPSRFYPPSGCPFHPRCPKFKGVCAEEEPPWVEVDQSHFVRCWDCVN